MRSLKGKTLLIPGASRGIGRAIALRAAADGANTVIAAKTAEPHPKLPGTIHSAADEVRAVGGQALPLVVDIREPEQVTQAIEQAMVTFGGIDVLVNNASAINLTGTLDTPAKRFDLMMGVNMRGTFLCSQACIPRLRKSANPHILVMSPPISMAPRWFSQRIAKCCRNALQSVEGMDVGGAGGLTGTTASCRTPKASGRRSATADGLWRSLRGSPSSRHRARRR